MTNTKLFKNGNSQAVRIPAELAYSSWDVEFGIACTSAASQVTNRLALDSLLEDILVAPFDAHAAKAYGPIRAAYKDRNRDALDEFIASHAVALDVTLVTNNEADFVNYAGRVVENWVNNH